MPYAKDVSGVYCLKTLDTKLIYIGSSIGLNRRKALHKSAIKNRDIKRASTKIMDAVDSGDTYIFEIIELCDNYLEKEQYWLDFYRKQDTYQLINQFDAERQNSNCSQDFKNRMGEIRKERWKDPIYRETMLKKLSATHLTPERLNKPVDCLDLSKRTITTYPSAKIAGEKLGIPSSSVSSTARGKNAGSFRYGNKFFFYQEIGVLNKLDELLETHQELRAISSQAWEAYKKYHEGSTTNQ